MCQPRPSARRHEEPEESQELLRRLASAAPEEAGALRERLAVLWMPLAARLARRYRGRGEALEDLEQVAALGLVKAVRRYDPERGHAFAGYAVPTIDGELKRHFRDHVWGVHVPRTAKELRSRVRAACRDLGTGDPAAVAEHTGLAEDVVRDVLASMDACWTTSLDRPIDGGSGLLHDVLGDLDPALEAVEERETVRPGLNTLTERERTLLFLRYFGDMKQSDIASVMGISQMHVSRLLQATCAALRADVGAQAH